MRILYAVWKFLNSNLGLLLVGFSLTTLIGSIFVDWLQQKSWERQTQLEQKRQDFEWERSRKFELLHRKLEEGEKSLDDTSDLINLRFFRLHKVYENILAGDVATAEKNWSEYMEVVERWNVKLITNQNKLDRLVSSTVASQFNNYETDSPNLKDPTSLHGHFFLSHKQVKELLDCVKNPKCKISKEVKVGANRRLRALDLFSDAFVDRASALFLERMFELEEFRTIAPANKALHRTRQKAARR